LYKLKETQRAWNIRIDRFLNKFDLKSAYMSMVFM